MRNIPPWHFTAKGSTQEPNHVLMCAGVARVAPEYPQSCTGSPRAFEVRDTLQEGAEVAKDNLDIQPLWLSDSFGLQVMVSALCQLTEFEIDRNTGLGSQYKLFDLRRKLQHYSDLLFTPENVAEIAPKVTIRNFQFSPAELFTYQQLVLFVSDDRPDMWPLVDRETPIARNKDLSGARVLFALVGDWMTWFADKNSAPIPSDPSRYYSDVKFVVFEHLTRQLWGGWQGQSYKFQD